MATLSGSTTENTEFTPAAGDFIIQATGGAISLVRKNSSGAGFASVGEVNAQALIVDNPVAGAVYKWYRNSGVPVVQADQ